MKREEDRVHALVRGRFREEGQDLVLLPGLDRGLGNGIVRQRASLEARLGADRDPDLRTETTDSFPQNFLYTLFKLPLTKFSFGFQIASLFLL